MVDLGVEPFLLAATLEGIVAQRLGALRVPRLRDRAHTVGRDHGEGGVDRGRGLPHGSGLRDLPFHRLLGPHRDLRDPGDGRRDPRPLRAEPLDPGLARVGAAAEMRTLRERGLELARPDARPSRRSSAARRRKASRWRRSSARSRRPRSRREDPSERRWRRWRGDREGAAAGAAEAPGPVHPHARHADRGGLPILRNLRILADQWPEGRFRDAVLDAGDMVEEGQSLSDALGETRKSSTSCT